MSHRKDRVTLMLVLVAVISGSAATWAQSTPVPTQRQLTAGEKTIVMKIILDSSAEPDDGTAPLTVKFSAKPYDDEEAVNATYLWDFGDRSPLVHTQNPVHTYKKPGTYRATVKVTNKAGQIGTDDFTITVHARGEE
ncbi:MAG TPA: PKD domain-containing protein [Candidatus Margulisiibacteriota bacterium]|nr:PKD domain-containing protein [Candidatus Margulisiibacteriota bacterium]